MFYNLKGRLINIKNVRNAHIWLGTCIRVEFNCGDKGHIDISCDTIKEAREIFDDFVKSALSIEK
jgi:hypothetical protein